MGRLRWAAWMALFLAASTFAQESRVSIDVEPLLFLPQRASAGLLSIGGGGELSATIDGAGPVYGTAGMGYTFLPTLGASSLNVVTATLGGGLRLGASDSVALRLGLHGGAYLGLYEELSAFNPTVAARAGVEVALGAGFRLRAGAGYAYHVGSIDLIDFSETSLA